MEMRQWHRETGSLAGPRVFTVHTCITGTAVPCRPLEKSHRLNRRRNFMMAAGTASRRRPLDPTNASNFLSTSLRLRATCRPSGSTSTSCAVSRAEWLKGASSLETQHKQTYHNDCSRDLTRCEEASVMLTAHGTATLHIMTASNEFDFQTILLQLDQSASKIRRPESVDSKGTQNITIFNVRNVDKAVPDMESARRPALLTLRVGTGGDQWWQCWCCWQWMKRQQQQQHLQQRQ